MAKHICNTCGSTRTRIINHGFDGWFLALWFFALVTLGSGVHGLNAVIMGAAILKTIYAFFQWKRVCKSCKGSNIIPLDSPLGKKLATSVPD